MRQAVGKTIQEGSAVGVHGRAHKVPRARPLQSVFTVPRRQGFASLRVRAPLTPRAGAAPSERPAAPTSPQVTHSKLKRGQNRGRGYTLATLDSVT